MSDLIKGIDVSSVQSNVPWQAVAAQGMKFAIMKCCQGNDGVDPFYKTNMTGAKAAGLYVGSYNFVYPLPPQASQPGRDPVKQAQMHFSVADNTNPVFCDLEWPAPGPDWSKWGVSASQICDWTLAYLAEYTQLSGKKPILYSYPYFLNAINPPSDFAQYPLWIASYVPTPVIPKPFTDWVCWQTTGGGGKLPNGAPVDTDVVKDFSLWGVSTPQMVAVSVPTVNTAPQTPPPPVGTPLNTMVDVQHALNLLGGAGTPLVEDGNNGPKTIAAIEAFQSTHGLPVDGIAGPATKTVLQGAVAAITPVVAPTVVVANTTTPDPIHPVAPIPDPTATGPTAARPAHPTLPPGFWKNVLSFIVNFAKNALHI
jgi:lysozyme